MITDAGLAPTGQGGGKRHRSMTRVTSSQIFGFLANIYSVREMIRAMVLQEVRSRYAGTIGGLFWSVIVPFTTAIIYAFVFSIGLKVPEQGGVPFILWFFCALIAWNLMADTVMQSANVVIANAHLVKKVVFPTEVLPLVNLGANLIIHGISLCVLLGIMIFYGRTFSLHMGQFVYFLAGVCLFTLGLSWIVGALNVFYRDLGQFVTVVMHMWFWLTPIVWGLDMFPENVQSVLRLNPMTYIAEGYRASFLFGRPIWADAWNGVYFWGCAMLFFVAGATVFRRLKPDFADVL